MVRQNSAQHLAQAFGVLSDETRLQILLLLESQPCLCVCHLQALLAKPQSTISRHLGVLLSCGWVTVARKGTAKIYRLALPRPGWLSELIQGAGYRWRLSPDGARLLSTAQQMYQDNAVWMAA
ncbi:ArsR/SmtB family transcription factor [Halothiobacillus sp. DCM-1]|uniref:ArsR/SmtB family transcription factor n=1 Tax=Halothiobacillus sp. DCM-1 TaxID=3112558 RepID=UPI0032523774